MVTSRSIRPREHLARVMAGVLVSTMLLFGAAEVASAASCTVSTPYLTGSINHSIRVHVAAWNHCPASNNNRLSIYEMTGPTDWAEFAHELEPAICCAMDVSAPNDYPGYACYGIGHFKPKVVIAGITKWGAIITCP